MSMLQDKLTKLVPAYQESIKTFAKTHGEKVIGSVTVGALLGGQRGIKSLLCDTSEVPADAGLIVRGIPIMDLMDKLPEEVMWLLFTGEMPTAAELKDLQTDLEKRRQVPDFVWGAMEALPKDSHPMAVFNLLILALERDSVFRRRYNEGMNKDEYWKAALDDSLTLIARIPEIAAGVYRWRYDLGPRIAPKAGLDWAANYAHMMGVEDKDGGFTRLMRLYMVLHTDHESGNVSAHTCHCVASALSDPYYAVSAGLNGLAGPLHGLANQEVLKWLLDVLEKFQGNPTDEQLDVFARETLNSGRVVPGYGHAVLRVVDPRFTAFLEFGKKECPNAPVFKLAEQVFRVVPEILKGIQKIKDPWPNVDSISGSLLHHYGVTQPRYYTVMFGVSRAIGMCSQIVMSRAWGEPIQRPKSINFAALSKLAEA
ncbi:MAG: citrate (Si)-synthase [Calditrichaeota bacterium]|nr:citrate (Si)-synthase [Calditrichota bacterium]MCB9391486.1 citrate (Si)-synthase [Calditrichota bacterium]